MEQRGYSQRRACGLVGMEPKTFRYARRRPDDTEVRQRLRALAAERRRFGYRRLHILLAREGVRLNHKRLFRLYRQEKLGVRKRDKRDGGGSHRACAMGALEAGAGHAIANGPSGGAEPALVTRLRVGRPQ